MDAGDLGIDALGEAMPGLLGSLCGRVGRRLQLDELC